MHACYFREKLKRPRDELAELYKMRANARVDLKRFPEAKVDYDKVRLVLQYHTPVIHTHTHTHTHMIIYIYIILCRCCAHMCPHAHTVPPVTHAVLCLITVP